jgi:uncharacterized protein involved in exopolysaccharide biosynthesis
MDELGRQLVAATTDRILREAEYRSASQGDPELVIASDPAVAGGKRRLCDRAACSRFTRGAANWSRRQAQLSAEHGPNFPRVVEIGRQLQDLDRQKLAEDSKLVERFKTAGKRRPIASELVRKSLEEPPARE